MLLSIVTGTFNRYAYLKDMIESARRGIPKGIAYEFIVVDGGSKDNTLNYCRQQSDIRLIEHGELRGAIRAFCDGANVAQGKYTILANDDILFLGDGILRAIVYLETHPQAGAVAFADDRPATGYGKGFKVQNAPFTKDGQTVWLPYAQVGLYRTWLGNLVGWWGADDPLLKTRTYGGDNYLSARIWELGYSVDAVQGCNIQDLVAPDNLRAINSSDANVRQNYHARFPTPPVIPNRLLVDVPNIEQLRVLYLPIFEPQYPAQKVSKHGLRDALVKRGYIVQEFDYLSDKRALEGIVSTFEPHILLSQVHGAHYDLTRARAVKPDMLVINWNGDVHENNLVSPEVIQWLKDNVDVQLTVNASVLPIYADHDIKAHYWQCAYEPTTITQHIQHDVLFLANCYSMARRELGHYLSQHFSNVGLYGVNWGMLGRGDLTYQFDKTASLRAVCGVEIGDNQYKTAQAFVSNRMFDSLANGALLLQQRIIGLEELTGLIDGVHYVAWDEHDDLKEKITYYLSHHEENTTIRNCGQAFVKANHSFDVRVSELFDSIIPTLL